jgi:glycosyltransferase involved in cell wall biosynthesis
MKIAYLTAGAAGMICGSCLHDNALAKAWIQKGHDCLLIPVYTPIRTDEEDVSIDRVFMGGINVYLQQKLPLLGYLPNWMDGFLNQSWLIRPLTKNAGKTSPKLLGALSVSMLQGTGGRQRKEFLRLLDWLNKDVQPDVVVFTNLLIGGFIPDVQARLKAKVLVTLQGDDIFLDSLPEAYRRKAIELMQGLVPRIDGVIVHSQDYADRMSNLLRIPQQKLHVIPLGIDTTEFRQQESSTDVSRPKDGSCVIGYLARMAPEKGLHRLVDAFIEIAHRPEGKHLKLRMAGWMGPQHAVYWAEQVTKLGRAQLNDRWEYLGAIDRKDKTRFLSSLDLFCVPTTYTEPKGLFLLEAIAAGVPYVQPNHGAFPEIHQRVHSDQDDPSLSRGRLFDAGSEEDLVSKLSESIVDKDRIGARRRKEHESIDLLTELDINTHAARVLNAIDRLQISNLQ